MGRCAAEGCATQTKRMFCFEHAERRSAKDTVRQRCRGKWCRSQPVPGTDWCVMHTTEASPAALVPVKEKPLDVRPVKKMALDGPVLALIELAVGRLQSEIETLERAKEILSRG